MIVNLRGNKPLLLDKVIYTEHPLSEDLKDSLISDYTPKWIKNNTSKTEKGRKEKSEEKKREKITWENF